MRDRRRDPRAPPVTTQLPPRGTRCLGKRFHRLGTANAARCAGRATSRLRRSDRSAASFARDRLGHRRRRLIGRRVDDLDAHFAGRQPRVLDIDRLEHAGQGAALGRADVAAVMPKSPPSDVAATIVMGVLSLAFIAQAEPMLHAQDRVRQRPARCAPASRRASEQRPVSGSRAVIKNM